MNDRSHVRDLRDTELTPAQCKDIVARFLVERGLRFEKLTARTIGFEDLLRIRCVFVKVHGWSPDPAWRELEAIARANHFRVETAGGIN